MNRGVRLIDLISFLRITKKFEVEFYFIFETSEGQEEGQKAQV